MGVKRVILAVALGCLSGAGWGGGFGISGKSASNLGNAFSGTTVLAEDASVVYTNPAAMQDMQGRHFSLLVHSIGSDVQFKDKGSNISGPSSSSVTDPHYVTNFYAVTPLSEDIRVGFGIYAPFGLGLDYDDNWKGRYITTGSDMKIINFSPALSFRASNKLHLGLGADFQYLNAELSNAVDFGSICYGYLPAGTCAGAGLSPQANDGAQTLTGSNWAIGYSLGLTYDVDEATRFGMTYHSSTHHDISGESDFEGQPALLASTFSDTGIELALTLPESLSLGMSHTLSPQLTLMADATWTAWSRYDELVIDFANDIPTSRSEQNWHDTWRLSVGGNYRVSETWLVRAGMSHDPTPIPDARHRSPRVPGATRNWVSLGSNVKIKKTMDLDLALSYTLPVSYDIDNTDSLGHNLKGEYDSEILYFTVQLNWQI
jgi:long-chain fatty acid transport protein